MDPIDAPDGALVTHELIAVAARDRPGNIRWAITDAGDFLHQANPDDFTAADWAAPLQPVATLNSEQLDRVRSAVKTAHQALTDDPPGPPGDASHLVYERWLLASGAQAAHLANQPPPALKALRRVIDDAVAAALAG